MCPRPPVFRFPNLPEIGGMPMPSLNPPAGPSRQGPVGLTTDQVRKRIQAGQVNIPPESPTKTVKQIVLENLFSFFNIIFFIIAGFLIAVGSFGELIFLLVVAANTAHRHHPGDPRQEKAGRPIPPLRPEIPSGPGRDRGHHPHRPPGPGGSGDPLRRQPDLRRRQGDLRQRPSERVPDHRGSPTRSPRGRQRAALRQLRDLRQVLRRAHPCGGGVLCLPADQRGQEVQKKATCPG